jgi:two-component system cell cycle response regulator
MIDVDHFKSLNDRCGHATGDAALRELARRLRQHLRAVDVVARYGGEEFLAVISGAGLDEAEAVAERLRLAVAEEPFEMPELGLRLQITVSIGVAVAGPDATVDSLIAEADEALYRAKELGRNRVEAALSPGSRVLTD